jgi:hypothetical protein
MGARVEIIRAWFMNNTDWRISATKEIPMKRLVVVAVMLAALIVTVGSSFAAERTSSIAPMADQSEGLGTAS